MNLKQASSVQLLGALVMALGQRRPDSGLLHHSDQGSRVPTRSVGDASTDYQTRLQEAQIACSMSRRGNCFDNAVVESFFGTLKNEMVHRCRFATRDVARQEVFAYIEILC